MLSFGGVVLKLKNLTLYVGIWCVCACMRVCASICTHVRACVRVCDHMRTCTCECARVRAWAHVYTCACDRLRACARVYTCVCARVRMCVRHDLPHTLHPLIPPLRSFFEAAARWRSASTAARGQCLGCRIGSMWINDVLRSHAADVHMHFDRYVMHEVCAHA